MIKINNRDAHIIIIFEAGVTVLNHVLVHAQGENRCFLHQQRVQLSWVGRVVFVAQAHTSESLVVLHADREDNWQKTIITISLLFEGIIQCHFDTLGASCIAWPFYLF